MNNLQKPIHLWPAWLLLFLLAGGGYIFYKQNPYLKQTVYDYPLVQQTSKAVEQLTGGGTGSAISTDQFVNEQQPPQVASGTVHDLTAASALPDHVRIQVPFQTQAPLGNWDLPYAEACEEASLILVHHFLEGQAISADEMNTEILDLVKTENDDFGYSADITVEQLADVAKKKYGYEAQFFYDFTIDDMKRLLAEGHPIIVPLAGRLIGNPHYRGQGPWYHMLVLTGYDGDRFITDDVGTKFGEGYQFPVQKIDQNIHDWNETNQDIEHGRRVILVLTK